MNEYLLYAAIGFGLLLVSLVVPGLKVVAEAIFKLLMDLFVEIFKHKGTFVIWFIKTLANDHVALLTHSAKARDEIDPTQRIRRKAKGYDDK